MTGRVAAEFTAIFLCGLGLHVDEVMRLGGPNVFVRFKKVGDGPVNYQDIQTSARRGESLHNSKAFIVENYRKSP